MNIFSESSASRSVADFSDVIEGSATAGAPPAPHIAPGGASRRFALITAAVGFLLTLATFFPGYMSGDTMDQYQQSLTFEFRDWHPPAMSFVWSVLNAIYIGPQPMLVLQLALLWGGVYFLLSALRTDHKGLRIVILVLLCSPAVLNYTGVLWKDVQLAATWSAAMAISFAMRARGDKPTGGVFFGLGLLVLYGILLRFNSGFFAAPLVLYVMTGSPFLRSWMRTAAAYLAIALFSIGAGKALAVALNTQQTPVMDSLFIFDITGIAVKTNFDQYPLQLDPPQREAVKTCFEYYRVDPLIWGDCSFVWGKVLELGKQDPTALRRAWIAALEREPRVYVLHRLGFMGELLRITYPPRYYWYDGIIKNPYGLGMRRHGLYFLLKAYVTSFSHTPLFRPVTWLLISGLLIWAAARKRLSEGTANFAMAASLTGLGNAASFIPFGLGTDSRYFYLNILTITFSLCIVAAELWQSRQRKKGGANPGQTF